MLRPGALLALALLSLPAAAAAQSRADVEAPTQAVSTDGALGHAWLSLRSDVVSPFLGVYGGTVELAPVAWLSVGVTPSYVSRDSGTGLSVDGTLRLWLLGKGLDGPFLGAMGGVVRTSLDGADTTGIEVGGDAGWQIVWGSLTVTLSGGAAWTGVVDGEAQGIEGWSARVRVELGATFR